MGLMAISAGLQMANTQIEYKNHQISGAVRKAEFSMEGVQLGISVIPLGGLKRLGKFSDISSKIEENTTKINDAKKELGAIRTQITETKNEMKPLTEKTKALEEMRRNVRLTESLDKNSQDKTARELLEQHLREQGTTIKEFKEQLGGSDGIENYIQETKRNITRLNSEMEEENVISRLKVKDYQLSQLRYEKLDYKSTIKNLEMWKNIYTVEKYVEKYGKYALNSIIGIANLTTNTVALHSSYNQEQGGINQNPWWAISPQT